MSSEKVTHDLGTRKLKAASTKRLPTCVFIFTCSFPPPAFKMCNKPITGGLRGALKSKTWSLAAVRRSLDGIIRILCKRHAGLRPCLTSGSHSCHAVWGGPTAHLSPSQSPSLAPSWSPSAPPQSTPPGRPRSATRMLSITSPACYLIRIKQSPAVHSCLSDSSRTSSKLTPLGLVGAAIKIKDAGRRFSEGIDSLTHL